MYSFNQNILLFPNFQVEQIQAEYKKLALELHPDKNSGDKEAEAKFQKIQVILRWAIYRYIYIYLYYFNIILLHIPEIHWRKIVCQAVLLPCSLNLMRLTIVWFCQLYKLQIFTQFPTFIQAYSNNQSIYVMRMIWDQKIEWMVDRRSEKESVCVCAPLLVNSVLCLSMSSKVIELRLIQRQSSIHNNQCIYDWLAELVAPS